MELNTTIDGANATIAVIGKLTVATVPNLETALAELPDEAVNVTLDLSELDYIASAGLRVVVSNDKALRSRGGVLRLIHPNDEVMDVLDATGLVGILTVEP